MVAPLENILNHETSPRQRAVAVIAALGIMLTAAVGMIFASQPLPRLSAYLPLVMGAIAFCEGLTAYLLVTQYVIGREPSLLVLACAYVFDSVMSVAYLLTFPGTFAPFNPLGAANNSPYWIWVFWTSGYPVWVMISMLMRRRRATAAPAARGPGYALLLVPVAIAVALIVLSIAGSAWLPNMFLEDGVGVRSAWAVECALSLNLLTIVATLMWGDLRRVLDLFLIVSLLAMFGYCAIATVSPYRFSFAWYFAGIMKAMASAGLLAALLWEINRLYRELRQAHRSLALHASQDGLTGIHNRRFLDEHLSEEWQRARRNATMLSVIMVDIDRFKQYNDGFGHQAGDACLIAVAKTLAGFSHRVGDCIARYGGEEFMMVFPGADSAAAQHLAEAARQAVLALQMPAAGGQGAVSISLGVATHCPHHPYSGLKDMVAAADQALYRAKHEGRNRVLVAS